MPHPVPTTRRPPAPWLCGILSAPVLLLLLSGCGGGTAGGGDSTAAASAEAVPGAGDGDAPADTSDGSQRKEKAISVDVAEIRRGDLVIPIFADGAIRTPRSVEVRTKISGELIDVRVRDGDLAEEGQLIAKIDPRQYVLALEESRSRHLQALSQIAAEGDTLEGIGEAGVEFAQRKDDLDRKLEEGTLTRAQFQARLLESEFEAMQKGAFRQEVLQQRTGLAEALVSEERAKLDLENTEIRAPFAGIVQGLTVVPGEIVSVGAPICRIYDNRRLEAAVHVLEADLGNLEEGRPTLLSIPGARDTIAATVDVISPFLDAESRTCEVLIRFENPSGRLRPGMFVRAEIAGWIHHDRLQAPKDAVLTRDDRTLLFKVEEERAKWLYVDTGLANADWVEILKVHSGGSLAPGDRVVVSNHLTLAHEAKLKVGSLRPHRDRWAPDGRTAGAGR
jgi:RND family efflux transporter MFP subunit